MKYATTVLCFFDVLKIQVFKLKHPLILCTLYSPRQKFRKFTNMISNTATTLTEVLKKRYKKAEFCKLSHKQQNTDNTNHVSCYNHNPLPACKPHAPPRRTSQDGSTSLTRRGNHPLPLLEQCCFETVPWAECIRFMAGHQFLHWLQNYTQLCKGRQEC
jgi:hypothetical protein